MGSFSFGARSLKELATVHPTLQELARAALVVSPVDFGVTEGARSLGRQHKLVAEGKSRTLKSFHIPKSDGFGYAIDVAAYVDGKVNWDFEHYLKIASAFAKVLGDVQERHPKVGKTPPLPRLRWGGSWDFLSPTGTPTPVSQHTDYLARMRKQKRRPLIDGVHFELHFI